MAGKTPVDNKCSKLDSMFESVNGKLRTLLSIFIFLIWL